MKQKEAVKRHIMGKTTFLEYLFEFYSSRPKLYFFMILLVFILGFMIGRLTI